MDYNYKELHCELCGCELSEVTEEEIYIHVHDNEEYLFCDIYCFLMFCFKNYNN